MATEAIFRLLSLGKEGHVISSPLLSSSRFHVLPAPCSTGFHGMLSPRPRVISDAEARRPEYCFPSSLLVTQTL